MLVVGVYAAHMLTAGLIEWSGFVQHVHRSRRLNVILNGITY